MTKAPYANPDVRHDFVYLFEVTNGNPNGDPDAANMPRVDPETNLGFVTDVSMKRKIRDFVAMSQSGTEGRDIFIQSQTALNSLISETSKDAGATEGNKKRVNEKAREAMCRRFYDIRMFGAVLSTGPFNAGQVRGPMQLSFARSIDPVVPLDLTITRQAKTTEERMETGQTEMGRKPIIPYGLYMATGHYNPFLGKQTGTSEEDLILFWQAVENMYEFDRSASRGEMAPRGLYVFTHESALGNAPSHKLFSHVSVRRREDVKVGRAFSDYTVEAGDPDHYAGVKLHRLIEG